MLFSEPKIPQSINTAWNARPQFVSVLFSEPKIPQFRTAGVLFSTACKGFSALQRAENSSIWRARRHHQAPELVSVLFSEPKIPQLREVLNLRVSAVSFSALQRAENSSMTNQVRRRPIDMAFQCSSASRKFLNSPLRLLLAVRRDTFQCSSASRKFLNPDPRTCVHPYFRPR